MLVPSLTPRIEEKNGMATDRIDGGYGGGFRPIAGNARKAQVLYHRHSTARLWDDVIDL